MTTLLNVVTILALMAGIVACFEFLRGASIYRAAKGGSAEEKRGMSIMLRSSKTYWVAVASLLVALATRGSV